MARQNRFYLLIAALAWSYTTNANSTHTIRTGMSQVTVSDYSIDNINTLCPTDSGKNCYTCNGYEAYSPQWENQNVRINEDCTNNNDSATWCTYYHTFTGGQLLRDSRTNRTYQCTTDGWKLYQCTTSNCQPTDWEAAEGYTGYEVQGYTYCAAAYSCAENQPKYRCAKNYYGNAAANSNDEPYGCTKCASSTDKNQTTNKTEPGLTVSAGKTTATGNCYIPSLNGSENYIDGTGSYYFNDNCYWS